ncbi:unnamed protein product [Acanthoscelides obtectus]|nr:unnamed protein product [Acanthoscelides obtectus]CAK1641744.1 hypothetical protein AOBTE_LOCUS12604 [Acanthoscelides obtectus]
MEWVDINTQLPPRNQVFNAIYYLLELILKPLITSRYKHIRNPKSHEINFYPRNSWQIFQYKVRNKLISSGYLVAVSHEVETIGTLTLYPKDKCESLDFRAIMKPTESHRNMRSQFKKLGSKIKSLYKVKCKCFNGQLYECWKMYTANIGKTQIHAIKIDLHDAFGHVHIDKLCEIISNSDLEDSVKMTVINHVRNQYVSLNGVPVKWNHGLIQGDYLSASLCELYIRNIEDEILADFETEHSFIFRHVDDYFFCSTNLQDISNFEDTIGGYFKINNSKTQKSIQDSPIINFCGHEFHIRTKEVSKSYDQKRVNRHRFKPLRKDSPNIIKNNWLKIKNPNEEQLIISSALKYSCSKHCFSNLTINTNFNSEEKLLKNIGDGMMYLAFKFHFAVSSVNYCQKECMDLLEIIVDKIIDSYTKILFKKHIKNIGKLCTGRMRFRHVLATCINSFIIVLKKKVEYKGIVNRLEMKYQALSLPKWYRKLPKEFIQKFSVIKMDRLCSI